MRWRLKSPGLLNRLFRRRSKKTSKLCVAGLCAGNSPVTGEFPAQMASNGENVSIWWRHHALRITSLPLGNHIIFLVYIVTTSNMNFTNKISITSMPVFQNIVQDMSGPGSSNRNGAFVMNRKDGVQVSPRSRQFMSQSLRNFLENIHSLVEHERRSLLTVDNSNVNFTNIYIVWNRLIPSGNYDITTTK